MFALPEKDRQAFFGILDEYFSQRPHLLNGSTHAVESNTTNTPATTKKAAPPPPPRQRQHTQAATSSSYYPPKDESLASAVSGMSMSSIHKDICLLYTSDAADDMQCVDLGGRRIIKKKKK